MTDSFYHDETLSAPPLDDKRVFVGDLFIAFIIVAYALLVGMLVSAVGSLKEASSRSCIVFLLGVVFFVALLRYVAWMMGFLIGSWCGAWSAGFTFGQEVEHRRNERDEE